MKKALVGHRFAPGGGRHAVAFLCLVQFVDVLGVTELITAMPRILTALSAPQSSASLLLTSYAMCFGGLLMFGARLGDRIGHRETLLLGIAVFVAGSLVAGTAASVVPLIAGRCLQGASAALSVPAALRLLIAATPRAADRRRALSAWSATGAAAGAAGYLLGGGLTELAGWRMMFWINLPVAVLVLVGLTGTGSDGRARADTEIDVGGAVLLTTAVASLVLAGSQLERPGHVISGLLTVAVALVLGAALIRVERTARNPLVPIEALRQRRLRIGARAAFLNTATTSSSLAVATLWLQRTQHLTPAAAGLRLLPFSLCVIAGSSLAAPALRRHSPDAVIAVGLGSIALGDTTLIALDHSGWLLSLCVAIAGAGIGLSSVAATGVGTEVPEALQATAAGALNTSAQLGTALGVAGIFLLASATAPTSLPLHGPQLGWAAAAAIATAGAVLSGWSRGSRNRGSRRFASAGGGAALIGSGRERS
jgi:MFS family permease